MAVFRSNVTFTDEQKAFAPDLEPAFENLFRALDVDKALITALKVKMINDRETWAWTQKRGSKTLPQILVLVSKTEALHTSARCLG